MTRSTPPVPGLVNNGVLRSIRMAGRTRRLPDVRCRRSLASQDVGPMSNRFQVVRIAANPATTGVVEDTSFGDFASHLCIDEAMNQPDFALEGDRTVTLLIGGPRPDPTASLVLADTRQDILPCVSHGCQFYTQRCPPYG